MKRHVVVDALSCQVGGGLTFLEAELQALEAVRSDIRLLVLASPRNVGSLRESLDSEIRVVHSPHVTIRLLYEQLVMPRTFRSCDLLYCPANFCPLGRTHFPIVLTLQNAIHFGSTGRRVRPTPRQRLEIALAHASVKRADAVIAISETLAEAVVKDGLPAEKLEVLLGAPPAWPRTPIKPGGLSDEGCFVLSIANDHPHKRIDDLVEAWNLACRSDGMQNNLVLAGSISGNRRSELNSKVEARYRTRFHILGPVSDRAEIAWLLSNASALISCSSIESFGLTLVEASSLGCPVIASDIVAHREVGLGASFVPVGDTHTLAERIVELADRQAAAKGADWTMTWNDHAMRLAEIFDRAMK